MRAPTATPSLIPAEPEFRAYHLLSLMAQHGKFKGDQQAFLATLQALRAEVKTSPPILWVLQLQVGWPGNECVMLCDFLASEC